MSLLGKKTIPPMQNPCPLVSAQRMLGFERTFTRRGRQMISARRKSFPTCAFLPGKPSLPPGWRRCIFCPILTLASMTSYVFAPTVSQIQELIISSLLILFSLCR